MAHQFKLVDKVGGITWSRSQVSTRVQKWCQNEKRGIFQENKHKSRKQDKIGKARKYENKESSENKESQKKEEKEGKPKKSKARKVCPLMGDLFSQVTKTSNLLKRSKLIL